MTILDQQIAIRAKGYQWLEHMFHLKDHRPECSIQLSNSKSPHCFTLDHEDYDCKLGWGRFDRDYCWQMAYEYIVLGIRHN